MESGDWVEIIAGIEAGDRVVTSAQFLIDSEASLAGSIRRLESVPEDTAQRQAENVFASGKIEAVDRQRRRLRIAHGPIEALAWPSMIMEFDVDNGVRLDGIEPGEDIRFALRQEHAGHWVVSDVGGRQASVQSAGSDAGRRVGSVEPPVERHAAQATVKAVDRKGRVVTLDHGPVDALGWPAMTMNFAVSAGVDLDELEPGQAIDFTMHRGHDGRYVVDSVRLQPAAPAHEAHDHD
jgi:membrane fusion protein, copper/silver efflux system